MARFGEKGQLVALEGNEQIPLTSPSGGAKVGGGSIAAGADAHATVDQIVAFVTAALAPDGASIGMQFLAETGSTADADPGDGNLRWNHATQTSATVLFLDDATVDGASLTAIWPRLNAGGVLFLQHATDQDTWQIWEVTAINDAAGYAKLIVTLWGASGTFADGDPILATLDKGQASTSAPKITSTVTSNTITPDGDTDLVRPSASLAAGLTIANPTTTPADGAGFVVDLIDNGTSRALTWGSKYANRMATLPTATTAGKRHRIGFEYHAPDDKLYCMYAERAS